MANLFPYPYAETTKTENGITFTDDGNGSITVLGTATADVNFRIVAYTDPITLAAGTYTLSGTGTDDVRIGLASVYSSEDPEILVVQAGAQNAVFTINRQKRFSCSIVVENGTTADATVTPGLVAGEIHMIDTENAKQIRAAMDVLIQVIPESGEPITITRDNLISAEVSLRSDLSRIEPSLPESEINVEAFFDEDMTETLSQIPEETPITYSAGYVGDMSQTRNFYLTGQMRWDNNVLSFTGRDAVHLLDQELPFDIDSTGDFNSIYTVLSYMLTRAGVNATTETFYSYRYPVRNAERKFVIERGSLREIIALLTWIFNVEIELTSGRDYGGRHYDYYKRFAPEYVDAGIPALTYRAKSPSCTIKEEDCMDVHRITDRVIGEINLHRFTATASSSSRTRNLSTKVGSFDWYKGTGAYINAEDGTINMRMAIPGLNATQAYGLTDIIPVDTLGRLFDWPVPSVSGGYKMFNDNLSQSEMTAGGANRYTQFVPWSADYEEDGVEINDRIVRSQEDCWEALTALRIIDSTTDNVTFDLYGVKCSYTQQDEIYAGSRSGEDTEITIEGVKGTFDAVDANSKVQEIYPKSSMKTILNAPIWGGSFTWKGDPRMQPKDRFIFTRLDGKQEVCIAENITLRHEGGGLTAEISYRQEGMLTDEQSVDLYSGEGLRAGDVINCGGNS